MVHSLWMPRTAHISRRKECHARQQRSERRKSKRHTGNSCISSASHARLAFPSDICAHEQLHAAYIPSLLFHVVGDGTPTAVTFIAFASTGMLAVNAEPHAAPRSAISKTVTHDELPAGAVGG